MKIICAIFRHRWRLKKSKTYRLKITIGRDVVFECERCGQQCSFHGWAFSPGSGALEYFRLPGDRQTTHWPHDPIAPLLEP